MTDTSPRFVHRVLNITASEYEKDLSAALLAILGRGTHDLVGIVAALNESGVQAPSAPRWSDEIFLAEIQRLGHYPNSAGAALGEHAPGIVPPGATTTDRVSHTRTGEVTR